MQERLDRALKATVLARRELLGLRAAGVESTVVSEPWKTGAENGASAAGSSLPRVALGGGLTIAIVLAVAFVLFVKRRRGRRMRWCRSLRLLDSGTGGGGIFEWR